MSLKTRIKQAQEEAALAEAKRGLAQETGKLNELEMLLHTSHSFDAVLARKNDNLALILPVKYNSSNNSLGSALTQAITDKLKGYDPKQFEFCGYTAYELTRKRKGRFPGRFEFEIEGVKINIALVEANTQLERATEERRAFGRRVQRAMAEQPYVPEVKEGFKFKARFDSRKVPSGLTYHLIALPKETRKYFPGLQMPFCIRCRNEEIVTHVTCAPRDAPQGALAGTYISKGIRKLGKGLNLNHHDMLRFKVIDPGKLYEIIGVEE